MTTLAAWLVALVGPLVVKGLIALAFTAVTFTGVTQVVQQLVDLAVANWASLPTAVLQLCALSGVPEVLGMIFGAYSARVAMWAAVGATRYVLKLT